MASYKIFQHPTLGNKAVRQGFAWEVFISEFYLGASRHKTKLLFVGLISVALLKILLGQLGAREQGLGILIPLASCVVFLYCGFNMNQWYEELLIEQGYKFVANQEAEGEYAALSKFRNQNTMHV